VNRILLFLASTLLFSVAADAADEEKKPGDSTGKNAPNHGAKQPTSTDQSERPEERKLTLAIRHALLRDKSLTTLARNVTIITANNRVTLRGFVNTPAEKRTISRLAHAAAGEIPVDDLIKVKVAN